MPDEIRERLWRLRHEIDGIVECAIYQTAAGLEVRASFNPDDVVFTKAVKDLEHGRHEGSGLHAIMRQVMGFEELPESLR